MGEGCWSVNNDIKSIVSYRDTHCEGDLMAGKKVIVLRGVGDDEVQRYLNDL